MKSKLVYLWKILFFLHNYLCTFYFSGSSSFFACCCFCKFFARPSPTMLFAWRRAFPNGLISTWSVFKNSTCQQLFRSFVSLSIVSDIWSRNFLPKRFLFSFGSNSDLFFNIDFACTVLFITPFKALRRLRYDSATFFCPTSIKLWVANFIKSLIET